MISKNFQAAAHTFFFAFRRAFLYHTVHARHTQIVILGFVAANKANWLSSAGPQSDDSDDCFIIFLGTTFFGCRFILADTKENILKLVYSLQTINKSCIELLSILSRTFCVAQSRDLGNLPAKILTSGGVVTYQ